MGLFDLPHVAARRRLPATLLPAADALEHKMRRAFGSLDEFDQSLAISIAFGALIAYLEETKPTLVGAADAAYISKAAKVATTSFRRKEAVPVVVEYIIKKIDFDALPT